jgi:hypothetical protein
MRMGFLEPWLVNWPALEWFFLRLTLPHIQPLLRDGASPPHVRLLAAAAKPTWVTRFLASSLRCRTHATVVHVTSGPRCLVPEAALMRWRHSLGCLQCWAPALAGGDPIETSAPRLRLLGKACMHNSMLPSECLIPTSKHICAVGMQLGDCLRHLPCLATLYTQVGHRICDGPSPIGHTC